MKRKLLSVSVLLFGLNGYAQVGIGTTIPNKSSQLDVVSENKGILITRVELKSTTDVTTISNGNVNSLLVFNNATQNDVTPGYYYWFENSWKRIINASDVENIDTNTKNVSLTVSNDNLILLDSEGNTVQIPLAQLQNPETVTTLFSNGTSFTYTNELNQPVTIDLLAGPQGLQGPKGDTGVAGPAGPQGPKGDTGLAGADGAVGPQGIQGLKGDAGVAGSVGPQGPKGDTGLAGADGAVGPQGIQGLKGDTGLAGPVGPQGPKGDTGLAGADGAVGPQGIQGLKGDTGLAGPVGPQGPKGDTGLAGAVGAVGPQGIQGLKGDTGVAGPVGPQGIPGLDGAVGPQGIQGIQGLKGDTGVAGPAGPQGIAGIDGAVGPQGLKGDTGVAGPQGIAGVDGAVGPQGIQGLKGDTGTFTATVDNGLNFSTQTNIQLGGPLVVPTTITTSDSNTLAIAGLQTGGSTDKILVADSTTGILKQVDAATLAIEPWKIQNTNAPATENAQNIYQQGRVAIGTTESYTQSIEQLHVKGISKFLFENIADRKRSNVMFYEDFNSVTSNYLVPGSDQIDGESSVSTYLRGNGNVDLELIAGSNVNQVSGKYEISTGFDQYSKGAGIHTFKSFKGLGNNVENSVVVMDETGLKVGEYRIMEDDNWPSNVDLPVFHKRGDINVFEAQQTFLIDTYVFPKTLPTAGQVLMYDTETGGNLDPKVVKTKWANPSTLNQNTSQMPCWFYAPSVVLPTLPAVNYQQGVSYNASTQVFTVNLYDIYSYQFSMSGNQTGTSRSAIKSPSATNLPVQARTSLEYFVTYFDNTVFDPNSITLDNNGVMTYKILPSAVVTERTYMNVAFKNVDCAIVTQDSQGGGNN